MDLFKLIGTIAIENKDAKKALQDVSDEGGKTESKMSKVFSTLGKGAVVAGKAIASGLAIGATACVGLATAAIQSYSEYEQLVGGSQLLFGDAFGYVEEKAKNAYKTVQMSTNDYLKQVNGFSTGLKTALGGNEQAAAELSHKIVVAEADIIAATGNTAENVQNAFNGIMKSNFTMLDNLQLGITPTKEGFQEVINKVNEWNTANGEATKYQIDNLADCQAALVDYIEMQGLAGYASNEAANTIQGSLGMLKGAWSNLLVGLSDPTANITTLVKNVFDSVVTFANNLVPRLTQVLSGIATAFSQIAPMITAEIPNLLNQVLPALIEGAASLLNGVASALPSILGSVTSVLPALLDGIMSVVDALLGALPGILQTLLSALTTMLPQIIDAVVSIVMMLVEMLPDILQPIIDNLPTLILSIVEALVNNLPILIEGLVQLILGIVEAYPKILNSLIDAIPTIISTLVSGLLGCLPQLIEGLVLLVVELCKALPQIMWKFSVEMPLALYEGIFGAIASLFEPLFEWFSGLWESLGNVPGLAQLKTMVEEVWSAISTNVSTVINTIKNVVTTVWNSIKDVVSTVLNSIKNVISTVWNAIKTIISNVMNLISSVLKGDWEGVKKAISNILDAIKSVIKSVWDGIKNTISSVMNGIKNVVSSIWNGIKTVISSVVNTIKSVVTSVWNGIKSAISTVVTGIKTTISGAFNDIKTIASNVWNGIKSAITNPIETAKNTISGIVDKIKGIFSGIKLQFPDIKMPHFSIKPAGWKIGDLLKGSIPKLGIDWYAKAMNNAMLLDKPTIFGYDSNSGNLMGGGEAGTEVVAGSNTLMGMIQNAVATQNSELVAVLVKILNAILLMNDDMGGNLREALENLSLKIGEREFARLVKAVN